MPRTISIALACMLLLLSGGGSATYAVDGLQVSVTLTIPFSGGAPAVQVFPASSNAAPLLTSEDGAVALVVVQLNQAPSATVQIPVVNPSPDEIQLSTTSLTFTPGDWAETRFIVVTGVDDGVVDGDQLVTIGLGVASGGSQFDGINPADVVVRNLDIQDPSLVVVQSGGTVVSEDGTTDTISVALGAAPAGPVVVTLTVDTQVVPSVSTLNFDGSTWNVPQVVTLSATDDILPNGTRSLPLTLTATGGAYNGTNAMVNVTVLDDDAAGIVVSPASVLTNEAGGQAVIRAQLSSQPQTPVTLSAITSLPGEATVAPASVTILPGDWQTPVIFTITGVDDALPDGNQPYLVTLSASGDAVFSGQNAALSGINVDDEQKTLLISGVTTLALAEGGSALSYQIRLSQPPTGNVTVSLADDDAVTVTPASVMFTVGTWNVPQTVSVRAVDDLIAQGNHAGQVTHTWSSGDPGYVSLAGLTLTFAVSDNDNAGVEVIIPLGGLYTTEVGGSATFEIRLRSQPTTTVSVPVVSSDPAQGAVSPAMVIFDAGTWNVFQTVTVTGVDGNLYQDGDVAYVVGLGPAISGDAVYSGRPVDSVPVVNQAVNHPPTLDALIDRTVNEDSGVLNIALSGIGSGQAGEVQALSMNVTSSDFAVSGTPVLVWSDPSPVGQMVITPPVDANGSALITIALSDGIITINRSFTLTITPVNDVPVIVRATQLVTAWHGAATLSSLQVSPAAAGQVVGDDVETIADQLLYQVVVAPGLGVMQRVDPLGGGVASLGVGDAFTQAEIDAGVIRFLHTSSSPTLLDALQFQLQDGDGGITPGVLNLRIDATVPAVELLPLTAPTWDEGDLPVLIAVAATLVDLDSANFSGGVLSVTITAGGESDDRLTILHEGDGAGQVGFDAGTGSVRYGGTIIGIASGGTGTPLFVGWSNAFATPAAAQAVLRRIAFSSVSQDPSAVDRMIAVLASDEIGNTSPSATHRVLVLPINDPPVAIDASISVVAGQELVRQLAASDPDSPTLTWSVITPPVRGTASIDSNTGLLTYQAGADQSGSDTLVVQIDDGVATDQATVTVRITGPDSTERLWVVSDPPLEAVVGDSLVYALRVDDSEVPGGATDLRFLLIDAPSGLALTPDVLNDQAVLTWTVAAGSDRHRRFSVLVWDETTGAADLQIITLHILDAPGGSN